MGPDTGKKQCHCHMEGNDGAGRFGESKKKMLPKVLGISEGDISPCRSYVERSQWEKKREVAPKTSFNVIFSFNLEMPQDGMFLSLRIPCSPIRVFSHGWRCFFLMNTLDFCAAVSAHCMEQMARWTRCMDPIPGSQLFVKFISFSRKPSSMPHQQTQNRLASGSNRLLSTSQPIWSRC